MLGCEWSLENPNYPESLLGGATVSAPVGPAPEDSLDRQLAAHALAIVEGPGADLIGTLRADEIIKLREFGKEVFLLQELFVSSAPRSEAAHANALARASSDYWDEICKYLRRTRPHMAKEPTRIAIFLREHTPRIAMATERAFSMGLTVAARIGMALTPGVKDIEKDDRALLAQSVSLDFVFYRKSESFKELKGVVPLRGWVSIDSRRSTSTSRAKNPGPEQSSVHRSPLPEERARPRSPGSSRIVWTPAWGW